MTEQFGTSGDDQAGQDEGKNFGQNTDGQTNADTGSQGIDQQEYEALRKRDEAAQAHIERLERENKEARDKVVELEDKLSNATTIDDALARMANQGDDQGSALDRTDVAQVVEEVLGQHQTAATQSSNWNTVQAALTKEFGDWTTADTKVQERARELDISIEDATSMAKQNPKAFMQLFVPQSNSSDNQNRGSSTGTGETGQRGVSSQSGDVRDKAWWNNLRRNDPNKYWSVEMQAQMRRDLFSE